MSALRLARRIKFPSHWPDIGVDPLKAKQRLSPTPYSFEHVSGPQSFVVTDGLYLGHSQWSQVFGGYLASQGRIDPQSNFVLKVLQSDLFPFAKVDVDSWEWRFDGPQPVSKNSHRYTDELMAWAEAHAYSKLIALQGTVIPRFIGAFMINYPGSEEEHMALMMSRIHGHNIGDRFRELGSEIDGDTRWYPLALELFRRVYEIHQHGIIGLDIREDNVLVVDDPKTGSSSIKLIDFASSRPNHFDSPDDMIRHQVDDIMREDVRHLLLLIRDLCGSGWGRFDYIDAHGLTLNYVFRRWKFLEWAQREHPDDPWVSEWHNDLANISRYRLDAI